MQRERILKNLGNDPNVTDMGSLLFFHAGYKVIANPSDTYCETSKDIREGGVDMRIEAYTQVQQLYQSQKVSRTQKTQTASHTRTDCRSAARARISRPLRQQWQQHLTSGKS